MKLGSSSPTKWWRPLVVSALMMVAPLVGGCDRSDQGANEAEPSSAQSQENEGEVDVQEAAAQAGCDAVSSACQQAQTLCADASAYSNPRTCARVSELCEEPLVNECGAENLDTRCKGGCPYLKALAACGVEFSQCITSGSTQSCLSELEDCIEEVNEEFANKGNCPGCECPDGKCPAGSCPGCECPDGKCPAGSCPGCECPDGKCPAGKCPGCECPDGKCPAGSCPGCECPDGQCPAGDCPGCE